MIADDAGIFHLSACRDCRLFIANGDLPERRESLPEQIGALWPWDQWTLAVSFDADKDNEFSAEPCQCCGDRSGGPRGEILATRLPPYTTLTRSGGPTHVVERATGASVARFPSWDDAIDLAARLNAGESPSLCLRASDRKPAGTF